MVPGRELSRREFYGDAPSPEVQALLQRDHALPSGTWFARSTDPNGHRLLAQAATLAVVPAAMAFFAWWSREWNAVELSVSLASLVAVAVLLVFAWFDAKDPIRRGTLLTPHTVLISGRSAWLALPRDRVLGISKTVLRRGGAETEHMNIRFADNTGEHVARLLGVHGDAQPIVEAWFASGALPGA